MLTSESLSEVNRVGWITEASPVDDLRGLAERLGCASLHVKRDDRIPALAGGAKVRKLDVLLAHAPWKDAPAWASVGAIGSGHLATMVAAAEALDRDAHAVCFWGPLSLGVVDNLAQIAGGAASLTYRRNRITLALRHARLLSGRGGSATCAHIPPGATSALSLIGIVHAGLELGEQVRAGLLPVPHRVFVPVGTGGMLAGLALGIALAGLPTTVVGVAVVERVLSPRRRIDRLIAETSAALKDVGVEVPPSRRPSFEIERRFTGRGYGRPTSASVSAVAALSELGLPGDAVYSGKAWVAMTAAAAEQGGDVLFWLTNHRLDRSRPPGWRAGLPRPLERRLERAEGGPTRPTRRRVLVAGFAVAAAAVTPRLTCYPELPPWSGRALAPWQAAVIAAAVPAVVADDPEGPLPAGPAPWEVAEAVDAFLVGQPRRFMREIDALFIAVEQGTALGGGWRRFTRLSPQRRLDVLQSLRNRRLTRVVYRGLRDLVFLGWYQSPRTWQLLEYEGPLVPDVRRDDGRYRDLVARPGALPAGTSG